MGLGRIVSAVIGVLDRLGITTAGVYTAPADDQTLAEVLTNGATTGATNLTVTAGQSLVVENSGATTTGVRWDPTGATNYIEAYSQGNGILQWRRDGGGVIRFAMDNAASSFEAGVFVLGVSGNVGLAPGTTGVAKVTDGSTGRGSIRADWPRRVFSAHKTPGTGATLTAVGGTPTHTLTGTASNVSDSTGHYVQLSADTALAGVDIATTECTKTENGPIVTFVIKTGAVLPIATERLWVGLSSASLSTTDSPTGAHVLAFRYGPTADATAFWRAVSNDGGADTGTVTVSTVAIAVSTRYVLTIDATNSASVTYYVNGALIATHTTNLPTATQALGTQCFVDDVAAGSTKELLISKIQYETN